MVYEECCLGPSRGAAWHTGCDSASKLCLCSHDIKFWTKKAYINSLEGTYPLLDSDFVLLRH